MRAWELTEYAFDTAGSLQSVTDPKDLETRHEYDDAGRRVVVISNSVDGTPSDDTDHHVRYVYTDGLQAKMWVDLDGDDVEDADDQVTEYTYGTTKGASAGDSNIGTGHLLQEIAYPDSTGGTDVVTFAYNAQSQEIYKKDQDGNVLETDYDDGGRVEHRRITTLAGGYDGAVRRITSAFDDLGRTETVTQYDNATVGSGSVVDEVAYTYDAWGPVSTFEQDHDSTVSTGGSLLYDVDFAYAKATSGRNTIQRSSMDLPDGTTVTYLFDNKGGLHDAEASRVTIVKIGTTAVAEYDYSGVGMVVGTDYPEVDVMRHRYGTTSGSYPDLDRFGRVVSDRWTKDLSTDRDFFDLDITYDRNSNITLVEDNVHTGFDVEYTMDGRNRLTKAEEGTWNGSSITSATREQDWTTLGQTGTWEHVKLDLDANTVYTGTGEYDDDRTYNVANELTARDTDDDGTDDFTLTYDGAGNLTDDGENYEYEYDAWNRLRKIKDTSDQSLVSEHTYNGLGFRIGWHYDVDGDGDVDGDDPWYRFVYDTRWRTVGTYRASDSDPKEQFVYHAAGNDGLGTASYIDDVILRDKDANTSWSAASDGTLEERIYYCQNWRHDVVALIDSAGAQVEQARYTAYGIPDGLPAGDTDSDGDVDTTDYNNVNTYAGPYDVRYDVNLDGLINGTDTSIVNANRGNATGYGVLSLAGVGNRKGYGGYESDGATVGSSRIYHVRNRVLDADLGRWIRRDPAGYIDGETLYDYGQGAPVSHFDPAGLACGSGSSPIGDSLPDWPSGFPPPTSDPDITDRECCERAVEHGEVDRRGFGWIGCCAGRMVVCTRWPGPEGEECGSKPAAWQPGCRYADQLILGCLRAHEECHIEARDSVCDPAFCELRWRACWNPLILDPDGRECACYAAEYLCLCAARDACRRRFADRGVPRAACRLRIEERMREIRQIAEYDHACVDFPPPCPSEPGVQH